MAKVVHQSKFRNIYGKTYKKAECYDAIQFTSNMFENNYSAVNPKFLAVATKSVGCFTVRTLEQVGRQPELPHVLHSGCQLMDLKWDPFNDNVLATSSDDGSVKIWYIPDGGLPTGDKEPIKPIRIINHHKRRVYGLEWHPTVKNMIATASADQMAAVFNIGAADEASMLVSETEAHDDFVFQVSWDYQGDRIVTVSKDNYLRVFDAHNGKLLSKTLEAAHHAKRTVKLVTLGESNAIATTGFNHRKEPEIKAWAFDDLAKEIDIVQECGEGSGCMFPFFDAGTHVLFIAAKGEGSVRYFEWVKSEAGYKFFPLFISPSNSSQKAMCAMPKRGVNYMACEIIRFYRLLNSSPVVEPVAFIVPRRAEGFQEDLFPDTPGPEPSLTFEEWSSGSSSGPKLVPIKECHGETSSGDAPPEIGGQSKSEDGSELKKQVDELKAMLEGQAKDLHDKEERINSLECELEDRDALIRQLKQQLACKESEAQAVNAVDVSPDSDQPEGDAEEN